MRILSKKEYLFKKNIFNKHSIGAYKQLYKTIGKIFEAIILIDLGSINEINKKHVKKNTIIINIKFVTREHN